MKFRKTLATLGVAVLVGLGLSVPVSASAHTGDLSVTAVCNTATGQYDLTAKLTTANTGLPGTSAWRVGSPSFEGTPKNANGMSGAIPTTGAQTVTLTTFSLPGTTTGKGPWVYAYTSWTDGYGKGSDGQLYDNLKGDCTIPIPEEPPALKGSDPVTVPECVLPLNGTATVTTTTTPWVQGYNLVNGKWELAEKSYGDPTVTVETVPSPDCEPVVVEPPSPANPIAQIGAVCGEATVVFTNPLIKDADQLTASFVVQIDGKFHKAYAVEAGAHVSDTLTFAEDSGNHKVEVFQAGTSEWKLIAESTVKSDCEQPPVVIPPTEPPVVTPPVTTPPTTTPTPLPPKEKPPVEVAEGEDFLAATGASGEEIAALAFSAFALVTLGYILFSRRKKNHSSK